MEHQRRQRITDPRIRRLHAARSDSVARHGGQRAEHQRGRVDGGDDGRGPVDAAHRRARRSPHPGMGAHRPRAQPRARRRGADPGDHHRPRRVGVHRLAVPPAGGRRTDRRDDLPARRARRAGPARLQRVLPAAAGGGHHGVPSECPGVRGIRPHVHACRRQGAAIRGDRRRRRRGMLSGRAAASRRGPHRVLRLVLRRIPDPGGAHLSSAAVRRGHQHLRDERLEHVVPQHRTVDRRGGLPEVRPPRERPGTARPVCRRCCARTR